MKEKNNEENKDMSWSSGKRKEEKKITKEGVNGKKES